MKLMMIAEDGNSRTKPTSVPVITNFHLTLLFSEGHLAKPGTLQYYALSAVGGLSEGKVGSPK